MERFIRSLSIRKRDCPKNVEIGDSNKPQSWLDDQKRVRDSSCSFPVEYLGYIEVFESRGIIVCEKAIKALKSSKSKCKKSVLYISGDAIRVIDEANKVLLVDQTLEKVSFCAPDRNIYEGFAYICRDATAKRWLCHGFLATKDSGERLSHALGCAFAVCLERKQAREKQKTQVTSSSSFQTSLMSDKIRNEDFQFSSSKQFFRQASLLERISDPQIAIVTEPVPNKPMVRNKFEVKRPRPSSDFFKRQHSLQLHSNSENCRKSEINFSSSCYVEDGDVFTIYEESVNNNIKDSVGDDNNNANSGSLLHSSFSKEGGRTMNEINNFGAETFSDSTTEFTQASTTNFASGGKQFSPSSHEISNSTRKLSEAESWLNNIAESLSLYTCSAAFNQPIQSHPENGSSTFHKGCSFFLSTSNPFSCGTAFDNSIPYKSQVSLQENSLATLGGRANPFL